MFRILALILLLPTVCLAQEKLDGGGVNDLLARLDRLKEENGGGMSAEFTETRQTRMLKEPLVTRGTMIFQSPDKFRRELTGGNASLTVSNGKKLWIYYPNFKEAELYTMGEQSFFDDSIAALTAGLSYTRMPEYYRIEGYRDPQGHRLVLTPKKRNLRRMLEKMTLHLSDDLSPVRTMVALPKGDQLVTEYRKVSRRGFAASQFEFTPPEGTNVTTPLGK